MVVLLQTFGDTLKQLSVMGGESDGCWNVDGSTSSELLSFLKAFFIPVHA
jgi:hypothetical protein